MNILVYAPQMAAFGGMERHVCDLSCVLAVRGHRVSLITTSNSLADDFRAALRQHGVTFYELPVQRGRAGRMHKGLWLFRTTLLNMRHRWDLIYTHGQSALARVPWLGAQRHTRIVHHHHTAADAAEQATWSSLFRHVLKRAPEIVACSRATQEALGRTLQRRDVRFLPYLTAAASADTTAVDRAYSANSHLHFGFMGRLVKEKGIDQICSLSLRPELQDITWHIHGASAIYPPESFTRFPNVVYHGSYTAGSQQAELLNRLDALVLFSTHWEGMPLSLIEAMSAGLPWIASDRGGMRELAISKANTIIVDDPTHLAALAAATREMSDRIRSGRTSRAEQRAVYDRFFSRASVANAWCAYLETPKAQLVR